MWREEYSESSEGESSAFLLDETHFTLTESRVMMRATVRCSEYVLPPFPWATRQQLGTTHENSIAFGSAPRREADSQPISPLARPAVSQTETETHSLGFLSAADAARSSGTTFRPRASSGRMVMQATADFSISGTNPGGANMTLPAPPTICPPGFEPLTENSVSAALPFDRRWCEKDLSPHCLEPSEHKLLTPPPAPPLKKVISSFRG